ncbi:hypothetical protein DRP77_12925 [Candidatus Poribacteria bacterium]|nr:MAG: hypothetical protein DRP77_12925 [Candidatus Poribacteria bacterium]
MVRSLADPYPIIQALKRIALRMDEAGAMRLGALLGGLAYHLSGFRRRVAAENVSHAIQHIRRRNPSASPGRIVRACFVNLGKNLIEFLRIPLLNDENLFEKIKPCGLERIYRSLERGRGVILFIPHLGNWELLAPFYGATLDRKAVIAFPLKSPRLDELVRSHRSRFGLEIIPKRGALRRAVKLLRRNYVVGFLADQDAGRSGVFIDFLGRPASWERAPVALALRTGAALHISADVRMPDDTHRAIASEPIELVITGDFERDVRLNTEAVVRAVEELICRYPDQWLWIHRRWKTQPQG